MSLVDAMLVSRRPFRTAEQCERELAEIEHMLDSEVEYHGAVSGGSLFNATMYPHFYDPNPELRLDVANVKTLIAEGQFEAAGTLMVEIASKI